MTYYPRVSRPRRSRFTAYFADGREPAVRLAYSLDDARAYYEPRGATRVVKGDYRIQARNAAVKAAGGFTIDQAALRDAIDLLGIKLPVRIRFNGRVGSTNGNYRRFSHHHAIMLKSYRTAEQASSTLWHELTHAMQAERAGASMQDWMGVRNEQKRVPYSRRPIEVEAREMSRTMANCPLTRPI